MKPVYFIIGIVSMLLGAVGVVLPVLPTTPFLLLPPGALRKAPGAFTAGLSQQHFIKIIWIPLYSTAP